MHCGEFRPKFGLSPPEVNGDMAYFGQNQGDKLELSTYSNSRDLLIPFHFKRSVYLDIYTGCSNVL